MLHHMILHSGAVYAVCVGVTTLAVEAGQSNSPWMIAGIALIAPIAPVLVSHMLVRRRVNEIHVLVNSRLTTTLDALQAALVDNIRLKERLGETVTNEEREAALASKLDRGSP